jgi:hypothetical protein
MQETMETGEPIATSSWAVGGSRVSWGAVLAGTVTMLAVTALLTALSIAVISLAMHPSAGSLRGSGLAFWICAVVSTLIGAFLGGTVAGKAPRMATRRLAMAHGFVAWGLALIASLVFQLWTMRGTVDAVTDAVAGGMLAEQSGEMSSNQAPGDLPGMEGPRAEAMRGATIAIDTLRGAAWSWFGTWFLAGILAVAAAGLAGRRRVSGEPREAEPELRPAPRPLTPAPTA